MCLVGFVCYLLWEKFGTEAKLKFSKFFQRTLCTFNVRSEVTFKGGLQLKILDSLIINPSLAALNLRKGKEDIA